MSRQPALAFGIECGTDTLVRSLFRLDPAVRATPIPNFPHTRSSLMVTRSIADSTDGSRPIMSVWWSALVAATVAGVVWFVWQARLDREIDVEYELWLAVAVEWAFLASAFHRQTHRFGLAASGACLVVAAQASLPFDLRSDALGVACLASLLWLVMHEDPDRSGSMRGLGAWVLGGGVPLLFAVWSCADDSFVVGWSVLTALMVGRGFDLVWHSGRVASVAQDGHLLRWIWLTGLAVAATLLGPRGLMWSGRLWAETGFASELLALSTLGETSRFATVMDSDWSGSWAGSNPVVGAIVGGSWLLIATVFRQSRRRVGAVEVLLLLLFTGLFCLRPDRGAWSVLALAFVLMPHVAEIVERWPVDFRLNRFVNRLRCDEGPLLWETSGSTAMVSSTIGLLLVAALSANGMRAEHQGAAASRGVSEPSPRVRPVGVWPLYDERLVVSDQQLRRVFSNRQMVGMLDPHSRLRECAREHDLARDLATAGQLGLSIDAIISTPLGVRRVGEMMEQLRREFRSNQPASEWPMLAFAFYLPDARGWIADDGTEVSFDGLARQVMQPSAPDASRNAATRLWSLAVLLRIDDQHPLLDTKTRKQIVAHLQQATSRLCETQHQDGSWDANWPDAKPMRLAGSLLRDGELAAGRDLREPFRGVTSIHPAGHLVQRPAIEDAVSLVSRFSTSDSSLTEQLLVTAQTLEWWALAPPETLPHLSVRARAAGWLCEQVQSPEHIVARSESHPHRTQEPQQHALRALALWRGRSPEIAIREQQL